MSKKAESALVWSLVVLLFVGGWFALRWTRIADFRQVTQTQPRQVAKSPQNYYFTEREAKELANQMLAAVNPDRPENAAMPSFMKEKILWLINQQNSQNLIVALKPQYRSTGDRSSLMDSGYDDADKMFINIYGARLIQLVRQQNNTPVGFNPKEKNTFALALVHEAIHLEQPASYFRSAGYDELIAEEVRTWAKMIIYAVRPMRSRGEPLESDFREMDDTLKTCNDRPDCEGFIQALKKKLRGAYKAG